MCPWGEKAQVDRRGVQGKDTNNRIRIRKRTRSAPVNKSHENATFKDMAIEDEGGLMNESVVGVDDFEDIKEGKQTNKQTHTERFDYRISHKQTRLCEFSIAGEIYGVTTKLCGVRRLALLDSDLTKRGEMSASQGKAGRTSQPYRRVYHSENKMNSRCSVATVGSLLTAQQQTTNNMNATNDTTQRRLREHPPWRPTCCGS